MVERAAEGLARTARRAALPVCISRGAFRHWCSVRSVGLKLTLQMYEMAQCWFVFVSRGHTQAETERLQHSWQWHTLVRFFRPSPLTLTPAGGDNQTSKAQGTHCTD